MKIKGFTLLEVVIILSCLAVLFLLGNISTYYLRDKNERQIIVDDFQAAVQYAKIQAISLGHPLYLAPSDATTLNWANGMVLVQANNNQEKILYQWQWHHPHWSMTWSGVYSADKILVSNNPGSAISNGQFSLFNPGSKEKVVMILNRIGRLRILG